MINKTGKINLLTNWMLAVLRKGFEGIVIIALICFILIYIDEIDSRQELFFYLKKKITDSQKEALDSDSKSEKLKDIMDYESDLDKLRSLISIGAETKKQELRSIRHEIQKRKQQNKNDLESSPLYERNYNPFFHLGFHRLSTNILLAMCIVLSGTLGALIDEIRDENNVTSLRRVSQGIAAGLIVFLVIKSGKYVFLMQTSHSHPPFNPYTSSFMGVCAGLFTQKSYVFLSDAYVRMLKKITDAIGDQSAHGKQQKPPDGKA